MKKLSRIHIGECYASKEPSVVFTLLGSCVSVCLFDPQMRLGGMNHILLPGKADMTNFNGAARYGINAMELLINKIMNLGGSRHRLTAKVFGGAKLISAISDENGMGRKNVAFVLDFLQREKIEVIARNTGGYEPRRIFFHTDNGDVFLKRVPCQDHKNVFEDQESKTEHIRRQVNEPGSVTLFE